MRPYDTPKNHQILIRFAKFMAEKKYANAPKYLTYRSFSESERRLIKHLKENYLRMIKRKSNPFRSV